MIRALLIILSDDARAPWADELVATAGAGQHLVLIATPAQAALALAQQPFSPSHIVLDIGRRGQDVLAEIDQLAQQCEPGTRVIAVGDTNDIILYRGLLSRGVVDYLPMPAQVSDVSRLLTSASNTSQPAVAAPSPVTASNTEKQVISFLSSGSGDGSSTAALNTAFAIAQLYNGSTILVDMDYQYGMVAKHLDLKNQYGIRELFDHPERGIDATLIHRMVAEYGKLHVITAPSDLRYLPSVGAEAIRDLIATLKLSYDHIILDLPHVWLPWVAAAVQQSTQVVLISQLWLKSVSHAARMMRVLRELNIPAERIQAVINRSGAKYKEEVEPKDFERVCGTTIRYTLSNDIKTIVNAEASARTILESEPSQLGRDIQRLARGLCNLTAPDDTQPTRGLFARLKG